MDSALSLSRIFSIGGADWGLSKAYFYGHDVKGKREEILWLPLGKIDLYLFQKAFTDAFR